MAVYVRNPAHLIPDLAVAKRSLTNKEDQRRLID